MDTDTGKVILVGAGPGDPGLLTIRGRTYLEMADCIIYDRLAAPELLSYAKEECELIYAGKENHHHTMKQEEINELLYRKALQVPLTVRLKGGDPYVFGRGGEEALYLAERGIAVEVIPGISSSLAVPAAAGIPVTHRGLSRGFQVITAHSRKGVSSEIDYSQLTDPSVTDIFLMGLSSLTEIAQGLQKAGRSAETPAAVISHGTTPDQRTCIGTLEDIAGKTEQAGLISPALVVVGEVVTLSEKLDFQEKKPLFGKSYLVPYVGHMVPESGMKDQKEASSQDSRLAEMLRKAGARVIAIKVGQIICRKVPEEEMRQALASAWLIFTSTNGVDAFIWNLKKMGLDARSLSGAKLAAIGTSTAAELEKFFLHADLLPDRQNGKALAEALCKVCRPGENLALFAAEQSNPELISVLQESFLLRKVTVYENCICENLPVGLAEGKESRSTSEAAERESADGIFFTSASAVKRTMKLLKGILPAEVYSIGPKCSEELRRQGIEDFTEAEEASYSGLYRCIAGLDCSTQNGGNII